MHGGNKVHLIDLPQLITAGDQNNSNSRLRTLWIDFLKDKNWIEEKEDSVDGTDFKVTKKGKTWLNRFESADIKVKN